MPLIDDSLALSRPEAIVLDGANGVLAEPRQHFPHGTASAVIALVALVATLALVRGPRRRWLPAVLLVAAVPGLWALLVVRADAPHRRNELASAVAGAVTTLEAHAPWPGGAVAVVKEEDDVRFPLGRYALPTRRPVATTGPRVELELVGSRLETACRVAPSDEGAEVTSVTCGDAP